MRHLVNTMRNTILLVRGLPTRLVSTGSGALMTAAIAWLVVMVPPMPAPSSTQPETESPASPSPAPGIATGEAPAETLLLRVETKPQGATLFLDGQKLGNTPFTVGRIKTGYHALRLEKADYSPVSFDLELNEDTVVDLTLDTLPTREQSAREQKQREQRQKEEENLLQEADRHLKADRLTRPKNGNAVEIYQKLAESEFSRVKAGEGIRRVIDRLLALGREDLDAWRLIQPREGNALERFRAVLLLDKENGEARAGLEEIVDRFLSLAQRYATDPDKAKEYIRQAEAILPDRARIAEVRANLFPQEKKSVSAARPDTSSN
ncbi:MAG: PEGA domain-containing protein [Magnetococcales bacterium]|nr:PEGA domain-containing protein [Magnetococcales bacterium]